MQLSERQKRHQLFFAFDTHISILQKLGFISNGIFFVGTYFGMCNFLIIWKFCGKKWYGWHIYLRSRTLRLSNVKLLNMYNILHEKAFWRKKRAQVSQNFFSALANLFTLILFHEHGTRQISKKYKNILCQGINTYFGFRVSFTEMSYVNNNLLSNTFWHYGPTR